MGDLSANLSRHEFACKCGCGFDTVDIETVDVIQGVCDHFICSVFITSGCRCAEHNKKVGGHPRSMHMLARAGDCKFQGVSPDLVWVYLNGKFPDQYGLGLYNSFIHIDTQSTGPKRWDKRGTA